MTQTSKPGGAGPVRTPPTGGLATARRNAAVLRGLLGALGVLLVATHPALHPVPWAAAAGAVVIILTSPLQVARLRERTVRAEEALSCTAAVTIVGLGEGRVTVLTLVWLTAVALGVLARGGRAGATGRILVLAALVMPMVIEQRVTLEAVAQALVSVALLLAVGRVSRETALLLRDPLTGALARPSFLAQAERMLAARSPDEPLAVVMVDLDDFGILNKARGHAAGDAALLAAAEALRSVLRADDALGRIGGDEFAAVVLSEDAEGLAGRMVAAVAEAEPPELGACAGGARWPRDGRSIADLLACADLAMRAAKHDGDGSSGIYRGPPLDPDGREGARAIIAGLCRGEGLRVVVQPIVDLREGSIRAYEALVRVAGEEHGSPRPWLALSESLGCRPELELACLRAALPLVPELPAGTELAVNLSAGLLEDPRTIETLSSCPEPSRLVLEVAEEGPLSSSAAIERALAWLRERDVRLALDETGAGSPTLGQLAVLRPAYVKLDRSLVRGLAGDESRIRLIRALAAYGAQTGCLPVAGGIETPAELEAVRRAGVPLAQGFIFGEPAAPWPLSPRLPAPVPVS